MSLASVIKSGGKTVRKGPLWAGPEAEGPLGGVTQSMISAWLGCKERFRVKYLEGWRAEDQFSKYLEYGQMWHTCEEVHARDGSFKGHKYADSAWLQSLRGYCIEISKKYPLQLQDIDHWRRTCEAQFPVYVDYWAKHKDVEQRTPLMQEQVFDVPYELPSGRTVRLRGKFDSVDLVGKGKNAGVYLKENKTKGEIERKDIEEQLLNDLQTMLYLVALERTRDKGGMDDEPIHSVDAPLKGVCYNVVRRPFSGGQGNIKRRKVNKTNKVEETKDQFYARLQNDYFKAEPEYWFMRWKSEVQPSDVVRFCRECLDPILEAMCNWYGYSAGGKWEDTIPYTGYGWHWRHPFGVKNSVDEGYKSDVDQYIDTGSTVGLVQATTLFTELQE